MVGSLKFLFHSSCLLDPLLAGQKTWKGAGWLFLSPSWCHVCCFALLVTPYWNRLFHTYENTHASSFKLASFWINLHTEMIPLWPYLLILHALDYVWSLVMYFSLCLWPWLPVNYFAHLVSWQRCTCRGKLSVVRAQSLRGINNWVGVEPCTSSGLARWMGQSLLWGVSL